MLLLFWLLEKQKFWCYCCRTVCSTDLLLLQSTAAELFVYCCCCWRSKLRLLETFCHVKSYCLICLFISAGTEAGINDCCNWFFYYFSGDSIAMSLQPTWFCNCNFLQLQRCYCHVLGDLLLPRVCYKLLIFFFQRPNRCWFVFFTT
jgi:hypothetical protein